MVLRVGLDVLKALKIPWQVQWVDWDIDGHRCTQSTKNCYIVPQKQCYLWPLAALPSQIDISLDCPQLAPFS